MSEDAMPLAELARLPKQAHELLSLYFELKPERDPKVMFGAEAVGKRGALERGYEARLAQIDPRVIPSGTGRPYLLARAEELRAKLERTYRQISPENTKQGPGAFILLERIGYGGFAEVFRARSTEDDSIVAVKRMRAETRDEAEFVRELFDEARLCRRIRHPNVVRVLTAGKNGDEMYLAMEYVDGGDLHSILKEAHKIHSRPIDALVKIIADASGGLHAAHSARDDHGEPMPILHRDVSPQNILISLTGEPKLTDFGIARAVDRGGSDPKTTPGTVRGKLPYLAPELLIEGGTASVRTDVYAMGMTLYAALARLPYLRKTPIATLQAILKEDLPLPSSFNAEIPPEIDAILLRCCARAPEQRYNSALEFQIELEQFLSRRPPVDVGQWVRTVFKKEPPKVLPGDEQSRTVPVFMAWTDVKLDL
jgi:serine/threonine protein kinase